MLGGHSLTRAALAAVLAASSFSTAVQGLFPDEAGRIDWYRAQIGVPKSIVAHTQEDRTTNILAITDRNVLASLKPDSGEIAWRQIFDPTERINALKVRGSLALTHSGGSEAHVRVWDAQSGALAWGFSQPPSPSYKANSGAAEFLRKSQDVLAVVGDSLVRLSPNPSKPVWELALNGTASYKRLVVQESVAFVIGDAVRTKRQPKPRLHVIEVSLKTGLVKQQYDVGTEQALGRSSNVVVESNEYGGYIVWRDDKNIVWNVHRLGMQEPMWDIYHAKLVQSELMPVDMLTSTLGELDADPGLIADKPRFTLTYTKDTKVKTIVIEMTHAKDKLELRKVVGFRSDSAIVAGSGGATLPSSGASQTERAVVAVRTSGDISWRTYANSKTPTHSGEFAYDTATYGPVTAATLYYAGSEPRVLIQTSGGLVAALAPGSNAPVWFRDESLAHATDMTFLELPAPASSAEHAAKATDPSILASPMSRYVLRWVETAKSLAAWPASGFGLFGGASSDAEPGSSSQSTLEALVPTTPLTEGDHFGFRKLSIFGTSTGVVAALSSQSGARSWTHYLADNGTAVAIDRVFISRRSQPLANTASLLTVVGRTGHGNAVVATLDALTGELLGDIHVLPFKKVKAFELPTTESATEQQLLGLATTGSEPRLAIWPATADAAKAFCALPEPVFFDLGASSGSSQLRGYRAECPAEAELDAWKESSAFSTSRSWTFDLPKGEVLLAASEYRGAQTTALLGRVLGDRSVLYKYINPHLVTLASRRDAGGIGIYFVDRVSGRLLYSAVHETASASDKQPFLATQSENRVIYQFWQESGSVEGAQPRSKGYVTVVAEMFESDKPDTRDESKAFSSFDLSLPHVITTAFMAPEPATALGVTRTGSQITTRDVLFGLSSGKLLSLPDQMFDPRRPKKAPTKDEQAEGLMPYMPSLPLDPKRVLSHGNVVFGIAHIKSAPTHLESTSLVASYGLDLFFTHTSPSGTFDQLSPSFSKVNLVVTTLALVIGCLLGGPMVRRKLTNQAWA
ncbi:hypothetical protein IWW39_003795 [Coemansia spiralis]|uniref:ER membrane protein complex subunit 1 n=1 Tax=Coemansia spiralis TaxID=417178 RepID=A0A9W8GII8_9FUNG|nr:hypothetical protein IWW39_003795 [Coemansia spiralis]